MSLRKKTLLFVAIVAMLMIAVLDARGPASREITG